MKIFISDTLLNSYNETNTVLPPTLRNMLHTFGNEIVTDPYSAELAIISSKLEILPLLKRGIGVWQFSADKGSLATGFLTMPGRTADFRCFGLADFEAFGAAILTLTTNKE